jgi:enoyl-CoA hydratase
MTDEIQLSEAGGLATIVLDRPKALNALTLEMIRAMAQKLDAWEDDDAIKAVVVKGAGEKAFCAGGDVRALWYTMMEADGNGGYRYKGPSDFSRDFFMEEYQLNHAIHAFSKPFLALLDGVTMGGGVGLSIHGSHRIATERLMFAMPETAIGLFPDVGGGWFMPRLPGETGLYLALTGDRLNAAAALALGVATHMIPHGRLEEFETALTAELADAGKGRSAVNDVLDRFVERPDASGEDVVLHREIIDRCFSKKTLEGIMDALEVEAARGDGAGSEFAARTRDTLLKKSPTSMRISFEQLRRGKEMSSLAEVLKMEYRMTVRCMAGSDYFEGVRAMLVDKDHAPHWSPASLSEVSDDFVAEFFQAVPTGEFTV